MKNNEPISDKDFFKMSKKYVEHFYDRTNGSTPGHDRGNGTMAFRLITDFLRNLILPREEHSESRFDYIRNKRKVQGTLVFRDMNVLIFESRMKGFFEDSDEWEEENFNIMNQTVKSLDTDEYIYHTREASYFSEKRGILVDFEYDGYSKDYTVFLYKIEDGMTVNELVSWFENAILLPSPYKGKVVKIIGDDVEIIKPVFEKISDYDESVEKSVRWMTSVVDEDVIKKLEQASLPGHAGLLLEGPPGSGKTTLVRRVIREQNEKGVSVLIYGGGSSIDSVFKIAEDLLPCLIVLEDAESIFGNRGDASFSEFLNAMDGVKTRNGLMVLATTNDSAKMDAAIVRPGRLEEHAKIIGVNPNAYHSMIAERLSWKTDKEIDAIVQVITSTTQDAVTPAMVDKIARSAIMHSMSQEEILHFVKFEWNKQFVGTDYTQSDF